jgi:HlyD family secretion protein
MGKKIIANKQLWLVFVILIIGIGVYAAVSYLHQSQPFYSFISVKRGDLIEEVKAHGTVKSAQNVDLAFQVSGKVAKVNVKVGNKVKAGQVLAELVNSDVRADMAQTGAGVALAKAQLQQMEANLTLQQVKKTEMLKGARPEQVNLASTQVANAQKALADPQLNLTNVKNKADNDLHNAQSNLNNMLPDAYAKANDAVNHQTSAIFNSSNPASPKLTINTAQDSVAGLNAESRRPAAIAATEKLSTLTSAIATDYSNAPELVIEATKNLQTVWDYLNTLLTAVNSSVVTTNLSQATLDGYRANINASLSAINGAKTVLSNYDQAVRTVATGNATAIQNAEIAVTGAKNTLNVAMDNLTITKEGATAEQVASQNAVISQAQSAIAMQRAQIMAASAAAGKSAAQLDKLVIKAPMDGQITVFNPKAGEIVSPGQPAVSMMTVAKFQIESYLTEADLPKVQIGSIASVTLDSYGTGRQYQARVVAIDPAATVNNGNTTYKVTLEFTKEDASIKPGLTANMEIVAKQENNTLIIPESAIIKEGNQRYVIVDNNTSTGERRSVTVGLITEDGRVSVTDGLKDGDRIADFGALAAIK